jgi:hypothetical protein
MQISENKAISNNRFVEFNRKCIFIQEDTKLLFSGLNCIFYRIKINNNSAFEFVLSWRKMLQKIIKNIFLNNYELLWEKFHYPLLKTNFMKEE